MEKKVAFEVMLKAEISESLLNEGGPFEPHQLEGVKIGVIASDPGDEAGVRLVADNARRLTQVLAMTAHSLATPVTDADAIAIGSLDQSLAENVLSAASYMRAELKKAEEQARVILLPSSASA